MASRIESLRFASGFSHEITVEELHMLRSVVMGSRGLRNAVSLALASGGIQGCLPFLAFSSEWEGAMQTIMGRRPSWGVDSRRASASVGMLFFIPTPFRKLEP